MRSDKTAVNVVKTRHAGGESMPSCVLKKEMTVEASIMIRSASRVCSIRKTSMRSNEMDGGEAIVVAL